MEILSNLWNIISVVLGISFVIFWHELGHFLLAKWNGVHVKTFAIGFPPKLIRLFKHQETEYIIGSVPVGGYVLMLGEDEGTPGVESGGTKEDAELTNHPNAFFNKSVWARMAIISAGVVMNLILGLILFAIVYTIGGRVESPAVVGAVAAGGPAYRAGFEPGDEILAIDDEEDLSFEELRMKVALSGGGQSIAFRVGRPGVDEPIVLNVEPERGPSDDTPIIGISQGATLKVAKPLGMNISTTEGQERESAEAAFQSGDTIIAVGPVESEPTPVSTEVELSRLLDRYRDQPLMFVVERSDEEADDPISRQRRAQRQTEDNRDDTEDLETATIRIDANPFRDFGFTVEPGPIVAFRPESLAAAAGLKLGDRIVAVNGDRTYNPLRLPSMLQESLDATMKLTIERSGKELEAPIKVEPIEAPSWPTIVPRNGELDLAGLGCAMKVQPIVREVRSGSLAESNGLKPGDLIQWAKVLITPQGEEGGKPQKTWMQFNDKKFGWAFLFNSVQQPVDLDVELLVKGRREPVAVALEPVPDWYNPDRGLIFQGDFYLLPSLPFGQAVERAFDEAKLRILTSYVSILRMAERRLSLQALSGPINIARAAYSFASSGMVDLLWFIGFISLNLAVVNFLPIPPLDGGKMVFLVGEAVRGRPLPASWQNYATSIGVLLILTLFAFLALRESFALLFRS